MKYGEPANAYGRSGQAQHGIDFVVYDGEVRIGVQCKHVAQGSRLDVGQVAKDIDAATAIVPRIARFILYTSAQSDPKTVNQLDAIKPIAEAKNLRFAYSMWRDFEEEVREHDLFDRLSGTPALGPMTKPVEEPKAVSRPTSERTTFAQSSGPVYSGAAIIYSTMLDEVKEYMKAGDVAGATSLVDTILKRSHKVPDAELARAFTSQAILLSRAGKIAEAAEPWRKAAEIEPDEALRHGRRAQALICQDRYEEALAAALPGLEVQPPSSLSALAALIAAQQLGRRAEIDDRISGRLKSERDVGLIRALVAIADGEIELANTIIASVDKAHPNDGDVISIRADLLLHRALGGPQKVRAEIVTGSGRRALEMAIPLYQQSLKNRDPIRERAVWLPSALNFISTLKLLNRDGQAADVAAEIIEKLGTDIDEFGRLVLSLAEGGRPGLALEVTEGRTDEDARLHLARASAFLHLGRFAEAESSLEGIKPTDSVAADNRGWMLLAARMQLRPNADFAELAEVFFDGAHSKLSACHRIVECASQLGHSTLTEKYARIAVALYEHEQDSEFLLFITDSLLVLGRQEDALNLLLPHVDLDHPEGGPLEERLAFCLLHRHRFESLGKLLAGLPADAADSYRFDGYRIDYQFGLGNRPAALAAIQNAQAKRPSDLKLGALEVALLRELGESACARERLLAIPFEPKARLSAMALYVREALKLDARSIAEEAAYRWIRECGDVPENAAWFLNYFLMGRDHEHDIALMSEVTVRCGICLKATIGREVRHWLVIDDRYSENVGAGWFAPHSHYVSELIGKQLLSMVDFGGYPGGPFVIETIFPVFFGAFQLINSRYGQQLPMVDSLRVMKLPEAGDQVDLSPIFKILDERNSATKRIKEVYAANPIPIGMLADVTRQSPIEFWASLLGTEDRVRAMSGDPRSAEIFAQRLTHDPPNIVLDPLTLMSWDAFGLLNTAFRAVKSISMTVSAVEVIRDKRDDLMSRNNGPRMLLGASGKEGQYQRTDVTPEMVQSQQQLFDRVLNWVADHVTVVPAPPTGLPEEAYSAMRISGPAYIADSFQLAANEDRILVADDIGLEMLAAMGRVQQVPTAALFRAAVMEKRITDSEFSHSLREMASANYEFISFNAANIWTLTDLKSLSVTEDVRSMIEYLRIPNIDLNSAIHVVIAYLLELVINGASVYWLTSSLTISLSALTRHATRETSIIFRVMHKFVVSHLRAPYLDPAIRALTGWLAGHFLTLEHVDLR